jgi:hypothetical protein
MFIDPTETTARRLDPHPMAGDRRRAPSHLAMAADPAPAVVPIGAVAGLTLRELHARWAVLFDEVDELHVEIDDVMHDPLPTMTADEADCSPDVLAERLRRLQRTPIHENADILFRQAAELERRHAAILADPAKFAALQAEAEASFAAREAAFDAKAVALGFLPRIERIRAAQAELAAVSDAIWNTPPATIDDIAALLDIALEEFDDRPGDDIWADWPWFCLMMQRLAALAPAVEFTFLRRHSPPDRDLVAEVIGADDTGDERCATAE